MNEGIRVLIVDDIQQVRQGLATILKLAARKTNPQIEVVGEAQNGNEAIQQAQKLQPDVILMDLEMPVQDGFTTTQYIKTTYPSIWVVVLSIHSDPVSRQKAALSGADAFVEKGGLLDELLQAIQRHGRSA